MAHRSSKSASVPVSTDRYDLILAELVDLLEDARGIQHHEHHLVVASEVRTAVRRCPAAHRGEMSNLTWDDLDFERCILHVARHSAGGHVQKWTPKDHERRGVPLPEKAIELLHQWKEHGPKDCPYVFMDLGRWEYYRLCIDRKTWQEGRGLMNNMRRKIRGSNYIRPARRFCAWAGRWLVSVKPFSISKLFLSISQTR